MGQGPEVVIVGAGPAGISAALRLARAGVRVLVLEGAEFAGAENWSGGVYHAEPLLREDVLGARDWDRAPRERRIVGRSLFIHGGAGCAGFEARAVTGNDYGEAWTVLRPKLDRYLASRAIARGATLLPRTAATGLRFRDGWVVGVDTARGPIEAPCVFLAEGDAAGLLARAGLERPTVHYAQGIKAVFALPEADIETRFGVGAGEGIAQEWLLRNGVWKGRTVPLDATGFVYTNRASVSVGLVLPLDRLAEDSPVDHPQLLRRFLRLPEVAALLEGATQVAYGAKVIRSGGLGEGVVGVYDGLAVGGASLGLGLEFPYPNFMGPAAMSGVAFADAVLDLRTHGDYSAAALAESYGGRLRRSIEYRNARFAAAWPEALHASPLIFEHLPALVALTCPSFNSYDRLRPDAWAGSTVSWGLDNRECSVRVASSFRGREMESTNVELKACDPSCNPYLALGGLILAGLDGIERGLEPPEPAWTNPSRMTSAQRERSGIRPLPGSLREALANLQADHVLFPALGDLLGRCLVAVRTAEANALEAMPPEDARRAHLRVF